MNLSRLCRRRLFSTGQLKVWYDASERENAYSFVGTLSLERFQKRQLETHVVPESPTCPCSYLLHTTFWPRDLLFPFTLSTSYHKRPQPSSFQRLALTSGAFPLDYTTSTGGLLSRDRYFADDLVHLPRISVRAFRSDVKHEAAPLTEGPPRRQRTILNIVDDVLSI